MININEWISSNISEVVFTVRYLVLEKIDPSPPGKRKENTDDVNYLYEPLRTPEFFATYSKQSQKILNPLVRVIGLQFYAARQRYQELLDKQNH